ncbi:unnamed protein product [Diabrotica balteata]|uniref:Reverse transcriptase domain-containing protein n=1 Tax=Diabrotica balteata TaxID=107213 RepID=A0A9P0DZH2_DIABA|nr:unnamed protein product [Diabrotica balteata]
MDEIIQAVRKGHGYRMGNKEIQILCYADDAALIAETEDKLQRLTHIFNTTAKKYTIIISADKTKCMTTSKYPLRCKIEIDGKIIKQEARFRYLGIDITGYGDVEKEVRQQSLKTSKAAGSLNDTIWKNKHLRQDIKKIYKAAIRPYTAETRPDASKTRRLLETTEMKILRRISGRSLVYRERSEKISRRCNIEDINGWVTKRK